MLLPGPYFSQFYLYQNTPWTATTQTVSNTTAHPRNLSIVHKHHPICQNSDLFCKDFVTLDFLDPVYCANSDGPRFWTNEPLFPWKWNAITNGSSHILSSDATKTRLASFVSTKVKFGRHKCPCSYYSNSAATFHLPLNPGHVNNATQNPGETDDKQSKESLAKNQTTSFYI